MTRYKRTRYTTITGNVAVHIVDGRDDRGNAVARCGLTGKQNGVNQFGCVTCGPCQDAPKEGRA